MLERLSGDYNRGYTKAIQDIIEIFKYVNFEIVNVRKKRMNYKTAMKLLKTILSERMNIRDRIGNGFICWNVQKQDFEYFQRSDKK